MYPVLLLMFGMGSLCLVAILGAGALVRHLSVHLAEDPIDE